MPGSRVEAWLWRKTLNFHTELYSGHRGVFRRRLSGHMGLENLNKQLVEYEIDVGEAVD